MKPNLLFLLDRPTDSLSTAGKELRNLFAALQEEAWVYVAECERGEIEDDAAGVRYLPYDSGISRRFGELAAKVTLCTNDAYLLFKQLSTVVDRIETDLGKSDSEQTDLSRIKQECESIVSRLRSTSEVYTSANADEELPGNSIAA